MSEREKWREELARKEEINWSGWGGESEVRYGLRNKEQGKSYLTLRINFFFRLG